MWPQRKRGSNETIPNSTVGKQVISQKISALENWRVNHHHLYKDNMEAQISLRFDNRIQRIESAAKHNEPKRTASSQVLKAAGTSSGKSHFRSNVPLVDPCCRHVHRRGVEGRFTLVHVPFQGREANLDWPT
jgi:hypothetical protein